MRTSSDLDGPLWLKQDRPGGVRLDAGKLLPPSPALWGEGPNLMRYDRAS